MPPFLTPGDQGFGIRHTVHITEFCMTMQFHTFFGAVIHTLHRKIRSLHDSVYRTDDQVVIKFIQNRYTLYLDICTFFQISPQFLQIFIPDKHLKNNGIRMIGNSNADNGSFIFNRTLFHQTNLSPHRYFSHFPVNFFQFHGRIIKFPAKDNVWIVGTPIPPLKSSFFFSEGMIAGSSKRLPASGISFCRFAGFRLCIST